jgi:trehalose/maltose hydrolase-like predicted phosphorylase
MKKIMLFSLLISLSASLVSYAQNPWVIKADKIDPANYYGITVANGMIGVVSSPEPFKVKNVVLAGAYDQYGRGRVSNFLNSFNLLNMYLEVDGKRLDAKMVSNFKQELDMQHAAMTTTLIMAIKQASNTPTIRCGSCRLPC